jgi:hypothetical protein
MLRHRRNIAFLSTAKERRLAREAFRSFQAADYQTGNLEIAAP